MPKRAFNSNTPDEIALLDAARAGKLDEVKRLLSQGLDPNTPDMRDGPWDVTPLMHASVEGQIAVMELLLSAKAKVRLVTKNVPDERAGETALHYAAAGGHIAAAKLLLSAKADLNKVSRSSGTPLAVAVEEKYHEMVKFLLECGADPDLAGKETGQTPLHIAVNTSQFPLVRLLVEHGADINARDRTGDTPFMGSTMEPDAPGLMEGLPPGINPQEPGFSISAMMSELAERVRKHEESGQRGPDPAIPRYLIAHGADLKAASLDGFTCLMHAVLSRAPWLVKEVIRKGVDLNAMNRDGESALDLAIRDELPEIQKLLRKAGARTGAELSPPKKGGKKLK